LDEYATLISKIDEGLEQGNGTQQAIEYAIKYCIRHNILSDYLTAHRAEVLVMLLMEYNEQKIMDYIHREGYEEGRHKGCLEGRKSTIVSAIHNMMFDLRINA
jgi:predicted transposase YdaD